MRRKLVGDKKRRSVLGQKALRTVVWSVLLGLTVVLVLVRTVQEQQEVVVGSRLSKACSRGWSKRAEAGSVVSDAACRLNASQLDAGVCVELAFRIGSRERLSTRCMPSLAVIGAMKCGTTNLMLYLSLHPRLRTTENALGWPVEMRFFSRATDADRAALSWRDYVSKFPERIEKQLTFDKSPNYVVNPLVPLVLRRIAPSIKLVATVRDPTRRAYSHFQHDCRNGRVVKGADGVVRKHPAARHPLRYPCDPLDFDNMIRHDVLQSLSPCDWSYNKGRGDAGILPRGFYACQLERWLSFFPKRQLLVLVFERFVASRQTTLEAVAQVESLLGLDSFDYEASFKVSLVEKLYAAMPSRQAAYQPMQPGTKQILDDLYCEPNRDLIRLFPNLAKPDPPPWPCLGRAAYVPPGDRQGNNLSAVSAFASREIGFQEGRGRALEAGLAPATLVSTS